MTLTVDPSTFRAPILPDDKNAPPIGVTADSNALLVKLDARPDFSTISQLPRGAARKEAAFNAIRETAHNSQVSAVALAEELLANDVIRGYETLVSPNMLVVSPSPGSATQVVSAFQALEGVREIYRNGGGARVTKSSARIPFTGPGAGLDVLPEEPRVTARPGTRPYGIDLINAPAAWKDGAAGKGLVYGSIDTGADTNHEAIAQRYRGFGASGAAAHDYNWFDATGRSKTPRDVDGHGTHTIGTVVGDGVGVAPEGKFIAASGFGANAAGMLKSIEWMLAPTKVDGSDPNPAMAPDVVGMSWWTGPNSEDLFKESMEDLVAAGIVPVKSAGNQGPRRGSITSPGQYPNVVATAAVDANGNVASFSSRGPAPYPRGSETAKPDFAAPGVNVISALPGNRYGSLSGTSMAQPHMSGAIMSILSRFPELSDEQLATVLKAGATDKGAPGHDIEYGDGLIDIAASLAAAEQLLEKESVVS